MTESPQIDVSKMTNSEMRVEIKVLREHLLMERTYASTMEKVAKSMEGKFNKLMDTEGDAARQMGGLLTTNKDMVESLSFMKRSLITSSVFNLVLIVFIVILIGEL